MVMGRILVIPTCCHIDVSENIPLFNVSPSQNGQKSAKKKRGMNQTVV